MSRYTNKIKVRDPAALTGDIAAFLTGKGMILGDYYGDIVWHKDGMNCKQIIIITYEPGTVLITAFINFHDMLTGETEMGIKGFIGLFGKRPLKKIVYGLEELIQNKAQNS